ncbi:hypothetical protein [Paenibacillus periandrae]|uniref:hypothetical protein n=1 Tax=Paenibacillus periandrae TaxID=1761741 RepID=UPI001F09EF37|nr:hypothetical protein [Paenibacillus periandrae]
MTYSVSLSVSLLVIAILLTLCMVMTHKLRGSKPAKESPLEPSDGFIEPEWLGIRSGFALKPTILFLENSFSMYYEDILRERVMNLYGWSDETYRILLFELKRYLIMRSTFKFIPLRGDQTRILWNEMIVHSDRFEKFCHTFAGRTLLPDPESSERPTHHYQAMFEWFYFSCYIPTEHSAAAWGGFHQYTFDQLILQRYKQMSHNTILITLFSMEGINNTPDIDKAANYLIALLRSHLHASVDLGAHAQGSAAYNKTMSTLDVSDIFPYLYTSYWRVQEQE